MSLHQQRATWNLFVKSQTLTFKAYKNSLCSECQCLENICSSSHSSIKQNRNPPSNNVHNLQFQKKTSLFIKKNKFVINQALMGLPLLKQLSWLGNSRAGEPRGWIPLFHLHRLQQPSELPISSKRVFYMPWSLYIVWHRLYISEYETRILPSSRVSIPLTRIGNSVIDLNHSMSWNFAVQRL